VDHARLDDCTDPHRADRLREAVQAVVNHDAHVGGAAVLDLGEHRQPELRTLAAVAGPQSEDVALTGAGDPDGHVDRPVGRHLPVADLDEDGTASSALRNAPRMPTANSTTANPSIPSI
jgi:hypothetical protein